MVGWVGGGCMCVGVSVYVWVSVYVRGWVGV